MAGEIEGQDSSWKSTLILTLLIVVGLAAAFWFTVGKPPELRLWQGDGVVPSAVSSDKEVVYLSSAKLLTDIYDMEPSKLLREGDVDGAIVAARGLLHKDHWNVKNLMCAGNVFTDLPSDQGVKEEGFDLLKTATYMCPTSKYVRLNYARQLGKAGRIEEAVKQYDQVIKTNLDTLPGLELARLYMSNDDGEKAIKLLQGMSEKEPENSSVQMLLGIAMARNHDEKAGYEEYIQAFGKARTLGYPIEARDLVAQNHDSIPDAINQQKQIADRQPISIEAKLLLAEMLIIQLQVPEAKAVLDSQKAKFKDNPELHRLYAEIYHAEGKEDLAYQEWLTANTLEKKFEEAASESKAEETKAEESKAPSAKQEDVTTEDAEPKKTEGDGGTKQPVEGASTTKESESGTKESESSTKKSQSSSTPAAQPESSSAAKTDAH